MPKASERLAKAGVNVLVILVAIAVFVIAFIVMTTINQAQRPKTVDVVAAAHDMSFGDPITEADLVTISVYGDKLASYYIPADQAGEIVGGYAALPFFAGQPIFRSSILATAAEASRLSAILSKYPGYSLFPLPLDAANVVAADLNSYLPGDLVSVTVVIDSRPQPPTTPTPMISTEGNGALLTPTPMSEAESAVAEALDRSYPPLSKNLFPQGVRVVAVQGVQVNSVTDDSATSSSSSGSDITYVDPNQPKRLVLLVPSVSVEALALGLQTGDMVVVASVTEGQSDTTAGFTYWDFEEMFRIERESVLK
jgi:Flp pilus assembly protein CpaB